MTDRYIPIPSRHASTHIAHKIIIKSAQYSEKPSKLPGSVFSNFPSILPSQQPALSSSALPTEFPMITPSTTPIRNQTQSPYNKPSFFSFQVKIPTGDHHIALIQFQLCCKY